MNRSSAGDRPPSVGNAAMPPLPGVWIALGAETRDGRR